MKRVVAVHMLGFEFTSSIVGSGSADCLFAFTPAASTVAKVVNIRGGHRIYSKSGCGNTLKAKLI